jgi:hypothetical protein
MITEYLKCPRCKSIRIPCECKYNKPTETRPKEWTLYFDKEGFPLRTIPKGAHGDFKIHYHEKAFPVIELSAYAKLQSELKDWREMAIRLAEALDPDHYGVNDPGCKACKALADFEKLRAASSDRGREERDEVATEGDLWRE